MNYNISIVGGGFCCNAILYHIRQILDKRVLRNQIEISIFEMRKSYGDGVAFSSFLDTVLLNQPTNEMSIDYKQPSLFYEYLLKHYQNVSQFEERYKFGNYLKDTLSETLSILEKSKIKINLINERITSIEKVEANFRVITKDKTYLTDIVIFSKGITYNNQSAWSFHEQYLEDIYNSFDKVKLIDKNSSVLILGTSLSATDSILYLKHHGHKGKIHCISRNKLIPKVRIPHNTIKMDSFDHLTNKDYISLRDCIRSFKTELKKVSNQEICWKHYFSSTYDHHNDYLAEQISKNVDHAQHILCSLNKYVELIWNKLSPKTKLDFINNYHSLWLANRAPMPKINAQLLLILVRNHELEYHKLKDDALSIEIKKNTGIDEFEVKWSKTKKLTVNYIIDTTKNGINIINDELYKNLISDKVIMINQFGGIIVDQLDNSCVDGDGNSQKNIKAVGYDTFGNYLTISDVEILSKHSERIAKSIINDYFLT